MIILVIGRERVDSGHRDLLNFQVGYIDWNHRVFTHLTAHNKQMKMEIQGQFLVKFFEFDSHEEAALFKLTYL